MAGRAEKHRAEVLPQAKAEPQPPGWGQGTELSPPGHSRGETKGGQGMGDSTGDYPCWS